MMASLNRVYDDFEPTTEWASEEGFDTLLVFLPGFKREEIKVQITSARNLRILGEHQVGNNQWSRFRKEFPISSNHDSHKISARFDNGILYIKHPKMIVPAEPLAVGEQVAKTKPTTENQKPSQPKAEVQRPERAEQKKESKEPPKPLDPRSKPELQRPERAEQKKESKEPPKPLGPRSKPELQRPERTDQKKETREPPKPTERKSEHPQPQNVDDKKEPDHIPKKTAIEKQSAESAPEKQPEKGHKPGEIARSSVPDDGNDDDSGTALQRKKKAEEEKVTDSREKHKKPNKSVHGGDRKTRKEMTEYSSGSRGRMVESYQKKMGHILVNLKKPGNIVNLVVAGLLVLVLALYMKKAVIPRGTIQSGILEGQDN